MDVAEILDKAAEVIETNGWYQGDYFEEIDGKDPKDCPVCAMGAVSMAVFDRPFPYFLGAEYRDFLRARDVLADSLEAECNWRGVPRWNDAEGRTVDEVVSALREAAEKYRNAEKAPAEQS